MSRLYFALMASFGLFVAIALVAGCGSGNGDKNQSSGTTGGDDKDAKTIQENLAKLSPEDKALAEKQRMCPVAEKPLGWMGVPYKITHEGQPVFFCCDGCEGEFMKDPATHLAKIKQE